MTHPNALTPESLLQHTAWVQALARRLVKDESRQDDLIQEVWLAALERPPLPGRGLRSWLATVARRKASDQRRSERRRERREKTAAEPEEQAPNQDLLDLVAAHRLVVEAVLKLAEPYRTTVILRYFRDRRPREIAAELDVPVKTVETRLRRGLQQLRGALDELSDGDRQRWCLALIPLAAPPLPAPVPITAAPAGADTAAASWLGMKGAALLLVGVIGGGALLWHTVTDEPARTPTSVGVAATTPTRPAKSGTDQPPPTDPIHQDVSPATDQDAPRRELVTRELRVEQDGSGDHDTIAAAVAAAEPHTVIRIGPGIYEEKLDLDRPVTLIGAGPGNTRITSPFRVEEMARRAGDEQQAHEEFGRLMEGPQTPEQQARIFELTRVVLPAPTVAVRDADVTLEELRITLRGVTPAGSVAAGAAVMLLGDRNVLRRCAVVESPATGILVTGRDARIEDCLVAAVQATGIAVTGRPPEDDTRIVHCDIRDGDHRGVTLERDTVIVERCRISGSRWHGIRYDDAAPTIRGNLLFGNKGSGIYASGTTRARVTGNVFLDNGRGYIAWYANQDTVAGNTFVANQHAGLSVHAPARPQVRRNIVAWSVQGIAFGRGEGEESDSFGPAKATPDDPAATAPVVLDLDSNLFHRNAEDVASLPPPGSGPLTVRFTGGPEFEPGFVAPEARDFALAEDSPARERGIGVAAPLPLESPWPRQEGEGRPLVLAQVDAKTTAPVAPTGPDARALAQRYLEAVQADADPAAAEEAVAWLSRALYSADPAELQAALLVYTRGGFRFLDGDSLRPRFEALLDTLRGDALVTAFHALHRAGARPGDLDRVLRAVESMPALRDRSVQLIVTFSERELEGDAAQVVLDLLDEEDIDVLRGHLSALWGVRVSPAIEARLLELSRGRMSRDSIYYAVSTLPDKSQAVVERLFEAARNPDPEVYGRALWGLQFGVRPEHRARVVDTAFELLAEVPSPPARDLDLDVNCIDLIGFQGTPADIPRLEALLVNAEAPEYLQQAVRRAIDRIQASH